MHLYINTPLGSKERGDEAEKLVWDFQSFSVLYQEIPIS